MSNLAPQYRAALAALEAARRAAAATKVATVHSVEEVRDLVRKADLAFEVPAHTDDDASAALANAVEAGNLADMREAMDDANLALRLGLALQVPVVGWMWDWQDNEPDNNAQGGLFRTEEEAKASFEEFLRDVYGPEEGTKVEWSRTTIANYDAHYAGWKGKVAIADQPDEEVEVLIRPWTWAPY